MTERRHREAGVVAIQGFCERRCWIKSLDCRAALAMTKHRAAFAMTKRRHREGVGRGDPGVL